MIESAIIGRLIHLKILMKTSEINSPMLCRKGKYEKPLIIPRIIAIK
jgi:hypothetical protein